MTGVQTCALPISDLAQKPEFRSLIEKQERFLSLYRSGAFAEALRAIDDCVVAAEALGWKQGYYDMMRERVDGLIQEPPSDWNGVYVAKEK